MTTFSQLVDEILLQTSRPDLLSVVASFANLTVREVFFTTGGSPALYGAARLEEALTAPVESGLVWTPAAPFQFQILETVRYDSVLDIHGQPTFPPEITPGRGINKQDAFYYRTGDSYALAGYGGLNAEIKFSYFSYPASLKYFLNDATRPASFDIINGWTYNATYGVDAATKAVGEKLVTNWVLMRWGELIAEGIRAKLYKHASDDARAKLSFSLFQNLRVNLQRAEGISSLRA